LFLLSTHSIYTVRSPPTWSTFSYIDDLKNKNKQEKTANKPPREKKTAAQRRAKVEDLARRKDFHTRGAQRLHDAAGGSATGFFDTDPGPFGPGVGMRMGTTPSNANGNGRAPDFYEKMLDRYALPTDAVELAVHGDGDGLQVPVMLRRNEGSRSQGHLPEEQAVFQRAKLVDVGKGPEMEIL
jgi:hypothetical protein